MSNGATITAYGSRDGSRQIPFWPLSAVIAARLPLVRTADAHDLVDSGVRGRVLLQISD